MLSIDWITLLPLLRGPRYRKFVQNCRHLAEGFRRSSHHFEFHLYHYFHFCHFCHFVGFFWHHRAGGPFHFFYHFTLDSYLFSPPHLALQVFCFLLVAKCSPSSNLAWIWPSRSRTVTTVAAAFPRQNSCQPCCKDLRRIHLGRPNHYLSQCYPRSQCYQCSSWRFGVDLQLPWVTAGSKDLGSFDHCRHHLIACLPASTLPWLSAALDEPLGSECVPGTSLRIWITDPSLFLLEAQLWAFDWFSPSGL